ncbi:hypothetical protein HMPREF1531_01314 [Propionibacterium sp. oral taxon 192 str. F0372]|nr:hypothetical protein HMPREF1531_01314 [Propionibacterium sp. oral taxon 192 str. F0372]
MHPLPDSRPRCWVTVNGVTDVVIIGAGIAGLAAAGEFLDQGRSVVVLEARDRVGGRILTRDHGGIGIDLGAQWLSPGNESMFYLAEQAGVQLIGPSEGSVLVRTDGVVRSLGFSDQGAALSPFETADFGQGVVRLRRLAERVHTDPTWASANEVWLSQPLGRWIRTNLRTPGVQRNFSVLLGRLGGDPDALSLRQALDIIASSNDLEDLYTVSGGLRLRRPIGGMGQIAEHLADRCWENIRLSTRVTGIEYDPQSATAICDDGQRFEANRVLLAMPPWLALNLDFNPPLPAWRTEMLAAQTVGASIKAVLVYDTPWWREHGASGQMSADDGAVRFTFDISDPNGPGVITGSFDDDEAVASSALTPQERENIFVDCLVGVLGPRATGHSGYLEHDWYADEFTAGAHSPHFAPGAWRVQGPQLGEPLGAVRFAGAEYPDRNNGYLEGAYRSGIEQAQAIIRSLA